MCVLCEVLLQNHLLVMQEKWSRKTPLGTLICFFPSTGMGRTSAGWWWTEPIFEATPWSQQGNSWSLLEMTNPHCRSAAREVSTIRTFQGISDLPRSKPKTQTQLLTLGARFYGHPWSNCVRFVDSKGLIRKRSPLELPCQSHHDSMATTWGAVLLFFVA